MKLNSLNDMIGEGVHHSIVSVSKNLSIYPFGFSTFAKLPTIIRRRRRTTHETGRMFIVRGISRVMA